MTEFLAANRQMKVSGPVNSFLVRSTRDGLRWTQEMLATHAGISVRVVAKAEAGGSVSLRTIARIGEAFRRSGAVVDDADLSLCPGAVVQQLVSHYRSKTSTPTDTQQRLFSRRVSAYVDGDPSWLKIAGQREGIDEVDRLCSLFFGSLDGERGTLGAPSQLVVAGHRVLAWGHESLSGLRGRQAPPLFVLLRAEVSAGRVAACWIHFDALGLGARLENQPGSVGNALASGLADPAAIRRGMHRHPS